MRILLLHMFLVVFSNCKSQEKVTLQYLGDRYNVTKNNTFLNREMIFLNKKDTLLVNIKIPFRINDSGILNPGIFYNCHLKEDMVYIFTLKKICSNDIPETFNNYYKTNTIPDKKDCSKFTEVEKNTDFKYNGNYGKYIDIEGVLYEIIGLTPSDGCFFPH